MCRRDARILWVVTGAGSMLRESAGVAVALARLHRVTVAFTRAGFEVARIFGTLGLYRLAAPGGYYRELVVEEYASGLPIVNRIAAQRYDAVVIAPASSDTVAKIVNGIADNIAASAASQALKTKTPLIVLPSDAPWIRETELPCRVDAPKCIGCLACIPVCPMGAIVPVEGRVRIELGLCTGCARCVSSCPYSAIRCFDRAPVSPSPLDAENLRKLERLGVVVAKSPLEILEVLKSLGLCTPLSSRL